MKNPLSALQTAANSNETEKMSIKNLHMLILSLKTCLIDTTTFSHPLEADIACLCCFSFTTEQQTIDCNKLWKTIFLPLSLHPPLDWTRRTETSFACSPKMPIKCYVVAVFFSSSRFHHHLFEFTEAPLMGDVDCCETSSREWVRERGECEVTQGVERIENKQLKEWVLVRRGREIGKMLENTLIIVSTEASEILVMRLTSLQPLSSFVSFFFEKLFALLFTDFHSLGEEFREIFFCFCYSSFNSKNILELPQNSFSKSPRHDTASRETESTAATSWMTSESKPNLRHALCHICMKVVSSYSRYTRRRDGRRRREKLKNSIQ